MTDWRGRESLGQPVDASGGTFKAICPHPPSHCILSTAALEEIFALAGGTSCPEGLSSIVQDYITILVPQTLVL